MIRTWLPIIVATVLIVALSGWEAVISDRFRGSGIAPEVVAERFAEIPMEIPGTSWIGEDREVEDEILQVAGAVNHINRQYTNGDTGDQVDVWLICGHARDVCRHTPNICYISQGFRQRAGQTRKTIKVPGEADAEFYTASFTREAGGFEPVRVFWAWNGNDASRGHTTWEAPDNQRRTYGNNTALYKLYFTARMGDGEDDADDSVAVDFAKIMLPEINKALFPEGTDPASGSEAAAESAEPVASAE